MELLYVWIEEYKNIKQQGFCFSAEYDIEYTPENSILKIDKREDYIEGFWGEQTVKDKEGTERKVGITNLTAIVGENGAGKSTLLRFLLENLTKGADSLSYKGIVVWKKSSNEKIQIYPENVSTEYSEHGKPVEKITSYVDFMPKSQPLTKKITFISYSNFYNPTHDFDYIENQEGFHHINISNAYLLVHDIEERVGSNNQLAQNNQYFSLVNNHQMMERAREIKVVTYLMFRRKNNTKEGGKIELLPFDLPRFLTLIPHLGDQLNFLSNSSKTLKDLKFRNELINEYQNTNFKEKINQTDIEKPKAIRDRIKVALWKVVLLNFLHNFYRIHQDNNPALQRLLLNKFKQHISNPSEADYINIQCFFQDFKSGSVLEIPLAQSSQLVVNIIDSIQAFIEILSRYWDDFPEKQLKSKFTEDVLNSLSLGNNLYHTFDMVTYPKEDLINAINYYFKSFNWQGKVPSLDYLSLEWGHPLAENPYQPDRTTRLSSGEQNFLSMVSRFYFAFGKELESVYNPKHYIALIDEGELTLHPEWQRQFVDILADLLNILVKEKGKTVQVILTTHSPLILSDVPKNNMIFLKKNEDGTCEVASDTPKQTFGANIHTLLADSFFLDSTMGSYAEEKIKDLLNEIERIKQDASWETLKKIKTKVEMIGEPILKNKIEAFYERKAEAPQRLFLLEQQLMQAQELAQKLDEEIQTLKKGGK